MIGVLVGICIGIPLANAMGMTEGFAFMFIVGLSILFNFMF